jgi:hypothetical protein
MNITVTSSAFTQGGSIPSKYTCGGQNISPPLEWTAPPAKTMSYALIADDPDAPRGTFTHWVVYNIPNTQTTLSESVPPSQSLQNGALHGRNDFGRSGYGGPCPPSGTHRYRFKVYALDTVLSLKAGASASELERAMDGHLLAQGELMGKYSRK